MRGRARGRAFAVRPAVAVQVLFLLFGVAIAAFFPFFAPFLRDRGLRPEGIGAVLSAMAVARILANPALGHLADTRLGRRTAFRVGAGAAAVFALILFAAPEGVIVVAAVAPLFAAVAGFLGPNLDAIALAHLGEERAHSYGAIRAWESLTYAAATLLLGFLLARAGVRWTMFAYAVTSLAMAAWSSTLEPDIARREEGRGRLGAVGRVLAESARYRAYLAASLLLWTGFAAAWNFIALRIEDQGGTLATVGIGFALGGAVEVPVMLLSPRVAARFGLRVVYVAGASVYATGFLVWGLLSSPLLISLAAAFEGFGFALLFTSGVAIVGKLVRPALHSTGLSVAATVALGIGQILGSLVGGFVYGRFGSVVVFAVASLLAWTATAIAWLALDTPALRRPATIEVASAGRAAPPHGPEAG